MIGTELYADFTRPINRDTGVMAKGEPAWWICRDYDGESNAISLNDSDDESRDLRFARKADCVRAIASLIAAGYGEPGSADEVTAEELQAIALQDLAW